MNYLKPLRIFLFLFLMLLSCEERNSERKATNNSVDSVETPSNKNSVNKNVLGKELNSLDEAHHPPSTVLKELEFYRENGMLEKSRSVIKGIYENEEIIRVTHFNFEDSLPSVRSIESKNHCAYSFTKYKSNRIITFDSIDSCCNHAIMYGYRVEFKNINNELPKYLRDEGK